MCDSFNLCNELHSVVVVMPAGPMQLLVFVTRCCVSWPGYLVFGSLVIIVVACYRAMQHVTVIKGLN